MSQEHILDNEAVKKRSIAGVVSYVSRTFLLQGIGLAATVALSAFLEPAEFGIYFAVTAIVGIFTFFSDIGLAAALVQKREEPTRAELQTVFSVQFLLAVGICLLIALTSPLWKSANQLGMSGTWLLYALAASFVITSFRTIPSILMERTLRFDRLVIPTILENIAFYGVAVVLAWKGFGVTSYTIAVMTRSLLGVMAAWFLQPWPIGFQLNRSALRHLVRFGAKFQLNDLLARLKDDLFVFVLGWWLGPTQLGYVGWAKRWSLYPYQLSVNSVMAVTFPTFSRLQHDTDRLQRALEKTLYFVSLATFPMLAGMSIFIFPFLELTPKFQKWEPAAWSLVFFAGNVAWSAISTPLTNTLNAIGEINRTLMLMVLWTTFTWTLTPILILVLGYNGVALASLIIGATSLATFVMVKKRIPKLAIFGSIRTALIATASLILVGVFGQSYWSHSYVWLLSGMMVCSLSYGLTVLGVDFTRFRRELQSLGLRI